MLSCARHAQCVDGDGARSTFCGGDYANLEPLRLRCSINTTTAVLKNCTYVFAGSYETITAEATLTAAGATPPLQRPLPG